ncbi:MAG: glutamate 5-kinase [Candidatus Omnitrophica bacterium]|nr:glutamate 5-kinase [Candidatus Omnitrophota bacterium]
MTRSGRLKRKPKRITIKVGTKVLTDKNNLIDKETVKNIADQISTLMDKGIEVILITSGAIGSGLGMLNQKKKGRSLSELQAIASIGQNYLMDIYNSYLRKRGYIAGQLLLTQEDFNDRRRFLNIRYTLNALLKYKALPIINENDSVSTEEIKCGDNDRLSSLVADLANSDLLVILTDVDGVYDQKGQLIDHGAEIMNCKDLLIKGKGSEESTGGMATKLDAVKNVSCAGIECIIARGKKENVILDVVEGQKIGTYFKPQEKSLKARKRWIAFGLKSRGKIIVDGGAEKALISENRSLLPSGVKGTSGVFSDGDVVDIVDESGRTIAKGLSNYKSDEIQKIMGKKTALIEQLLGYKDYDEVIHRDNLVILG